MGSGDELAYTSVEYIPTYITDSGCSILQAVGKGIGVKWESLETGEPALFQLALWFSKLRVSRFRSRSGWCVSVIVVVFSSPAAPQDKIPRFIVLIRSVCIAEL